MPLHPFRGSSGLSFASPSNLDRVYLPDVARIFPNRAIAREFSHAGSIQNRHLGPVRLVAEGQVHFFWHSL
jgi:hypothetical protein